MKNKRNQCGVKKFAEEEILKQIYSKNCEFASTEEPDFIVKIENEKFGVEVTSFFYNESSARLKKMPGYTRKILNSTDDSVLDKRDKDRLFHDLLYLKIDGRWEYIDNRVSVKYSENQKKNVLPEYQEIEEKILRIIDRKNKKAEKYQKLDYLELIIKDEEAIPFKISEPIGKSEKILKSVMNSKFKRLYFLSKYYLFVYGEKAYENMNRCANLSGERNV